MLRWPPVLWKRRAQTQHETWRFQVRQYLFFPELGLIFISHTLDENSMRWLMEKPTMLVGMDVTHPGPGAVKGAPSIAAVTASYDDEFTQFPASLRMQESKKEVCLQDLVVKP